LSNDGKPLTSLELGETYKKLKNYGYNATEIAKRVGKSVTHVIDMIEVAGSTKEVKDSINEGTISATLVSEVKKGSEDKEKADEIISTVVQIRKEEGGTKVTKKDFTGLVKEKKKVDKEDKVEEIEHVGTRTYSDKVTFTEKEVAELLRQQIFKCAQQIVPAFRSKILRTPLVI
jgi:ParB-like chromosome segregation protein Spo0J